MTGNRYPSIGDNFVAVVAVVDDGRLVGRNHDDEASVHGTVVVDVVGMVNVGPNKN